MSEQELAQGFGFNLGSGVEKSQETRWRNGKDMPEGESLNAHTSGSKVRPRQTCGGSVPPAQSNLTAVPVLADAAENESGEARESTKPEADSKSVPVKSVTDSRGGSQQSPVHAPAKAVTGARSVLRGAGRANSPKADAPPVPDELHRDPFFSSKHKLKEIRRWRKRSWPLWSDTF